METYLRAFVNFDQNHWTRLLPMAEFTYNNTKNANTGYTPFELNCRYHPRVSYKEDLVPRSKSRTAIELFFELQKLMTVCQQKLHHVKELQKRGHNKRVKPHSYAPGEKVWLNSKYLKTKRNHKLEAKFLGLFRVLHPIDKQAYSILFGFPLHLSHYIRRFFTNHTSGIFWFYSSVLPCGQEIFYQSISYLPHCTPWGQEYDTQESGFSSLLSYSQAEGFFTHSTKQISNNVDK